MVKETSWFGNVGPGVEAGDGMAIMKTGLQAGVGMLALGVGAAAFGAGMEAGFG